MPWVNEIEDPDAMCPGGSPEIFAVGPAFGGVYPCEFDGCVVTPLWGLHLGATEMWCAKTAEGVLLESDHIPIVVPEVDMYVGLLAVLLTLLFWRWIYGQRDSDNRKTERRW